MKDKLIYKRIMAVILLLPFFSIVNGQKKDSLAIAREFIQVCNVYKRLPLYLNIELQNSTNFITDEQDTASAHASFYIQPGISYVRFGEVEQFVNDSLALLVSDKLRQMILSGNGQSVLERMKAMTGALLEDSAITVIIRKYKTEKTIKEGKATIELQDRVFLYTTSLPREYIKVEYSTETKIPIKVITMRRSLLQLDETDYKALSTEPSMSDKVLVIEGNRFYVIKEQFSEYVYKEINHENNFKMPAIITDRIVKNNDGNFEPVKNYEAYRLITN